MRKTLIAATAAAAFGVAGLGVGMNAAVAQIRDGHVGGGGGHVGGGGAPRGLMNAAPNVSSGPSGPSNSGANNPGTARNFAPQNGPNFNPPSAVYGNRYAWHEHDHDFDRHRHRRFFGFGGIYAFGGPWYDYDYDSCYQWRRVWTPYGWRWRDVWVCY
jgi:hypothetical protein